MGLLCINILGNKDACLLVVVVPIEWGGELVLVGQRTIRINNTFVITDGTFIQRRRSTL